MLSCAAWGKTSTDLEKTVIPEALKGFLSILLAPRVKKIEVVRKHNLNARGFFKRRLVKCFIDFDAAHQTVGQLLAPA